MEERLTQEMTIAAGVCDSTGRLGMWETFLLYMNAACSHADMLGCGLNDMREKGLLWVAVRNMVRFIRRPAMGEKVNLTTWPVVPGRASSERDYMIRDKQGNIISLGRTEWTVVDRQKGRIISPGKVFSDDIEFSSETTDLPPFTRFRIDPSLFRSLGSYRVRSTDCDVGGHMNNVAYVRMMCSALSTREWKELSPDIMEAYYVSQMHEDDGMELYIAEESGRAVFRADSQEGKTVFWMSASKEDGIK